MNRRALLGLAGALGVAVAAGQTGGAMTAPADRGQATPTVSPPKPGLRVDGSRLWRVRVGGMSMADGIDAQAFRPSEITINAGDSIWFDFGPMPGLHTVTFLSGKPAPPLFIPDPSASSTGKPPAIIGNPAVVLPTGGTSYDGTGIVNSGLDLLRRPGDAYLLTFTKPGSYAYECIPHGAVMKAQVTVQEQGASLPHEPADYDRMAADQFAALVARGTSAMAKDDHAAATRRPDGTTLWEVSAGAGGLTQARVMRFLPARLTIKTGDTVRWVNHTIGEPHTVTFTSGQPAPKGVSVERGRDGSPKLMVNSAVMFPAGGARYHGTGYVNSGFFDKLLNGKESYELTFVTPGEFPYVCVPHQDMGMVAQVIVTGRQ